MRFRLPLVVVLAFLMALMPMASGAQVYRWVDKNGVVHYGDRKPANAAASKVRVIPVAVEPSAIARLRVEAGDGDYLAWADNSLAGPIEVLLAFTRHDNVLGEPGLPARATVPARGSVLVARLRSADPGRTGMFELSLTGVPGNPIFNIPCQK